VKWIYCYRVKHFNYGSQATGRIVIFLNVFLWHIINSRSHNIRDLRDVLTIQTSKACRNKTVMLSLILAAWRFQTRFQDLGKEYRYDDQKGHPSYMYVLFCRLTFSTWSKSVPVWKHILIRGRICFISMKKEELSDINFCLQYIYRSLSKTNIKIKK